MTTIAEPSAGNGDGTGVECSACGHVGEPVGRGQCGECRAFVKGNVAGMIHGGRREHPIANPESSALFQQWAAELGGDEELTAGQRTVLCRVVEADVVCQTALDYVLRSRESLVSDRVLTALDVLAKHTGSVLKGARLLGLERRGKVVPTFDEELARVRSES